MAFLNDTGLMHLWSIIKSALGNKVDKVSGKGLSTNDYTTAEKNKLAGIAAGANVNQNAFSNVTVGSTTVAADSATDTLTLVAGSNVSITPDATNDKITISATVPTKVSQLTNDSGYKTTDNNTTYSISKSGSTITLTGSDGSTSTVSDANTTYGAATTSTAGLMSVDDKKKLNGVASGAEVNQNAFSNVVVGSTTVAADSKTDTLTLVAGSNVTLTPDATNDKITIASKDTVYTHPSYSAKSTGLYKVTVDGTGHVSAATAVTKSDITALGIPASDTNTHYDSGTIVNNSATATANTSSALTNGNVYLNHIENGAVKNSHKISGSGATSVTSDASGNIVISSTDTNTNTWRPVVDNLTSTATDSSLSANQGKVLKGLIDGKAASSHTHDDRYYTESEINSKLSGKSDTGHTHSSYVNQNAFSNVVVGSTTVAADSATDTLTLVAGSNVTLTPDATNDKITIAATNTTYSNATTSASGLMSSSDKSKLDGIAAGANKTTVDSALSSTSTNPVQNKVVNAAISNLNNLVGGTAVATQISNAVSVATSNILSMMMPVGYIFQWVPTNGGPDLSTAAKVKAYYGFGTWEEISGRFLLGRSGSYGVGSTGGNETHTHTNPSTGSTAITVAQMPSHEHGYRLIDSSETFYGGTHLYYQPGGSHMLVNAVNGESDVANIQSEGGGQGHTHTMGSTGSTNHMPPYLSVYIWKRTA